MRISAVAIRTANIIDDYLLFWVLLAVGAGLAVPSLERLSFLSTPILAFMIGAVSLTLSPEKFRAVRGRAAGLILIVQSGMPFFAFGIASLLHLPPALSVGFVVLGAVTPELVTPTMTELSGGDTALSTVVLLLVGFGTLIFVPGIVTLLFGNSAGVDPLLIVKQLLLAVIIPMSLALVARHRWSTRIKQYDDLYPSVSGLMVILIIGIVTAGNATVIRSGRAVLVVVLSGALVLNVGGYTVGWISSRSLDLDERIAATLSVGMRDFAVAAALLVGAGFPPTATLPPVLFGVVEMTTSSALTRWFRRTG